MNPNLKKNKIPDSTKQNQQESTLQYTAQTSSSQANSYNIPPQATYGSYMYVPMPPPANQPGTYPQFQQYPLIPEQKQDMQYISNNQQNLSATEQSSEVLQAFYTPKGYIEQKNQYVQSYYPIKEVNQIPFQKKSINIENFQILSNSKINNMDISSKSHNMIIVDNKAKEFIIQPFDEYLKKDKLKNKQLVNSNLIVVQDNNINVPEFTQIERKCQLHMKTIEAICVDNECKKNNEILLCKDCARNHKGHTLYDIPEVLFLIQKNSKSLENDEEFMNVLRSKTFSDLKILKSNIIAQLEDIDNKLIEGFKIFQQYLFKKKGFYEQAFKDIQSGSISKMMEQINNIYNQGVFQEVKQNSNELQYKQLASSLEQAKQSIKKFEQLLHQQNPQDQVKIKINNEDFLIQNQKIQNLNDLYFQIKIDALKQNQTNILDQGLLLSLKNKATKLKGNPQLINIKDQVDIQVISYLEI